MKKQDTIKVAIAVACLVVAGIVIFVVNSGGGTPTGTTATGQAGQATGTEGMTEDEWAEFAEQEGGVDGGTLPGKPMPQRR